MKNTDATIDRLLKIREVTTVNANFDMTADETAALMQIAQHDLFTAITHAYIHGYARGRRALLSEQKRNNR